MKGLLALFLILGSFTVSAVEISALHSNGSDCGDRSAQTAIINGSGNGATFTGSNIDG